VLFEILPDPTSTSAPSPAAVAMDLAVQAADPNSALRRGSLTASVSVSVPAGLEELAQTTNTMTAGAVPKYFSTCEAKTYTSRHDMKQCYTCCNYLCQTGPEVPQVGGMDVLPGFRSKSCQSLCLAHVRYSPLCLHPNFVPSAASTAELKEL